jgi:hypothetical protein
MGTFDTSYLAGATSKIGKVKAWNITAGTLNTGTVFNTSGLVATYTRDGAAVVTMALVTGVVASYVSCGFIHRGAGVYEFGIPTAALATSADGVDFTFSGVSDVMFSDMRVEILGADPRSSATPNVNVISIASQTASAAATVVFPATLASTSNVTTVGAVSGAVGSVTGNVGGNVVGSVGSVTGDVGGNLTGNVGGNVTGSVGSVTGAVGSVTGNLGGNVVGTVASVVGNVGGNVVGSVGSVTGAVGSVTGAVGSVTGNVGGNVVGTVASVVGAVGSVTGNVGGNVTGSVGSVTGAVGSVTGNVGGNVVGSVASVTAAVSVTGDLSATMKASVNAEVLDVLVTDTFAEPSAPPAATASLKDKIGWNAALSRNKIEQTATTQLVKADDGTTTIGTATVSDDGTTATRGEFA